MNNELVSVIIPAFNCEQTIEGALRSILDQTHTNTEIIVVDDNSTDDTEEVVRRVASLDSRIKLFSSGFRDPHRFDAKLNRNINAGYSARNTGLKHATGAYITFQDADDASLLNRIEIQMRLLKQHNATHITTDWIRFEDNLIGKKLDYQQFLHEKNPTMIGPVELCALSQKTKGLAFTMLGKLHRYIPFSIKRMRILNKLFFGSVESYPGVTGIPLFKREVIDNLRFRKLSERVWPSFMGRGADRDFSFRVAELFKNSYVFFIPLYLWRVKEQNDRYDDGSIRRFVM